MAPPALYVTLVRHPIQLNCAAFPFQGFMAVPCVLRAFERQQRSFIRQYFSLKVVYVVGLAQQAQPSTWSSQAGFKYSKRSPSYLWNPCDLTISGRHRPRQSHGRAPVRSVSNFSEKISAVSSPVIPINSPNAGPYVRADNGTLPGRSIFGKSRWTAGRAPLCNRPGAMMTNGSERTGLRARRLCRLWT